MLRIWEITGVMNAGGTESLIMEMLRHKPDDCEVELIIQSGNSNYCGVYDDEIRALGIKTYQLPSVGSVGILAYTRKFHELIAKVGKPNIVHIHLNAVSGFIARAAYICGIPVRIIHSHADIHYRGNLFQKARRELSLQIMRVFVNRYATHNFACSPRAAKRLFYNSDETLIVPNMIDVQKYLDQEENRRLARKKYGIAENTILVGCIGRVAPIKNYEMIVEALSYINNKYHIIDIKLIILGRCDDIPYFEKLKWLIKNKQLEEKVIFAGNVQDIYKVIGAFDVYAMPSHSEGLGIAALEAQAAGVPTLLSRGVPEEADLKLGTVMRFSNAEELAKAILEFRPTKPKKEEIRYQFMRRGLDSCHQCQIIYDIYKSIAR